MRRTKAEAAKTRSKILRAALTEFSTRGYSATRLEFVARRAGVTRGAIYWHFPGKIGLYQALLETYSARSDEVVAKAVAEGGSLREIVRRVMVRLLETIEKDPALRQVMELFLFKTERTAEVQRLERRRVQASQALLLGIARGLEEGVRRGELRRDLPVMDMVRGLMGMLNGAVYLWLLDPRGSSLAATAPALAEIYLDGISTRL